MLQVKPPLDLEGTIGEAGAAEVDGFATTFNEVLTSLEMTGNYGGVTTAISAASNAVKIEVDKYMLTPFPTYVNV